MNSINLVGRICQDIELKQTQDGIAVCNFSLAVSRPNVKDTTDFIPVVCWRQSAEYLAKYAGKGVRISVTGILTTRKYKDKNGNDRTGYEVVAQNVSICDSRQAAGSGESQPQQETDTPAYNAPQVPNFEPVEPGDDLPF